MMESRTLVLCLLPGGRARLKWDGMACSEEKYMRRANLGDAPLIFGLDTWCPPLSSMSHPQNFPFDLKLLLGLCLLPSKESGLGFYTGETPLPHSSPWEDPKGIIAWPLTGPLQSGSVQVIINNELN